MVDERDVEDAQAGLAAGGIEVFAARLDREDLRPAQAVGNVAARSAREHARACPCRLHMLAVIIGIGQPVQRAADDRLRLVALGDHDGRQPVVARRDPAIAPDEIDVVRPLHQKLGHDRVVVVVLREMAVGAHLGIGVARHIGTLVQSGRPFAGLPGWFRSW